MNEVHYNNEDYEKRIDGSYTMTKDGAVYELATSYNVHADIYFGDYDLTNGYPSGTYFIHEDDIVNLYLDEETYCWWESQPFDDDLANIDLSNGTTLQADRLDFKNAYEDRFDTDADDNECKRGNFLTIIVLNRSNS